MACAVEVEVAEVEATAEVEVTAEDAAMTEVMAEAEAEATVVAEETAEDEATAEAEEEEEVIDPLIVQVHAGTVAKTLLLISRETVRSRLSRKRPACERERSRCGSRTPPISREPESVETVAQT
jgi:hypothetical protein